MNEYDGTAHIVALEVNASADPPTLVMRDDTGTAWASAGLEAQLQTAGNVDAFLERYAESLEAAHIDVRVS